MSDVSECCPDILNRVLTVKRCREDGNAFILKRTDFIEPCLVKCSIFGGAGHF